MKKILIVEDEKELQRNIELLLCNEGYETITANDGLEVLKKMKEIIPDLIISDIMMPYIDGYELFKRVKKDSKTKIIPFIFLTAKNAPSSVREGMNLGADDYITKPFDSYDLLHAIATRLEKSNIMNKKIDQICDSISKYVPHEFRTPLVAILGYSQIINSDLEILSQNEIREIAERIEYSANRLHKRIDKFIQLAELEINKDNIWTEENNESIIDDDLLREILHDNYIIDKRKEKIEATVCSGVLKIPGRYLRIIITELLENAVKFSEPDTSIIVRGKKEKDCYKLEIKDSGAGMDDFQISQIGAFQQFNREFYQQEGNGLGLIFVKKIINIVGGKLDIESIKEQFTNIKIELPLV